MITFLPPYPAILLKTEKTKTMIVGDLHLGWEMALSKKGFYVPTQMPKLLKKLTTIVSRYKPEKLLILGDVKYSVAVLDLIEWHDIPDFFHALKKLVHQICIVRGNHDGNLEPLLPEDIKILPAAGITIGGVGFFHGHKWPSPRLLKCNTLIMGHVHPVVAFRDLTGFRITKQVWVKINCNGNKLAETLLPKYGVKIGKNAKETLWKHYKIRLKTSKLLIMPSFNDFLGGKPLNERKKVETSKRIVGPILRSEAVNMENAETYLLDGTFLGTIKELNFL